MIQSTAMPAIPHVLHAQTRKLSAHHAIIIGKHTRIYSCLMVSALKIAQVATTRTLGLINVTILNSNLGQQVLSS
jgi:hypothetical protein